MKRTLKKGGYSAVLSLIVIAAVIVFNLMINRLPESMRKFDLSGRDLYTISHTTQEVLQSLDKEVTIYVAGDPDQIDERITTLVNRYQEQSDHIHAEIVDTVLHPEQLSALDVEPYNLLIVCEETGKRKVISFNDIIKIDEMSYYMYNQLVETEFDGEGQITSAISQVTSDAQEQVYVTQGHGESQLSATVQEMMEKFSLNLETVNLLEEGGVPEDCSLLLINNPQKDLAVDERAAVSQYLNQGGQVMILAGFSAENRPNLDALLAEYGMVLERGYAADTSRFYQNNAFYIFPEYNHSSPVVSGISDDELTLLTGSGVISFLENVPDGVETEAIMTTSENGLLVDENGNQTPGQYTLAASATKELDSGQAVLTLFACPEMIDEGITSAFTNLANLTLFMNGVTANFEDIVNISIPAKSLQVTYNTIPSAGLWASIFIFLIPVFCIGMGFAVWMRRRKL